MRRRSPLTAPPVLLLVLPLMLPLMLLCPALPLRAVSVYLHRTVAAGQEAVLLGDIATVVDVDPQAAGRLRQLPLWRGTGKPGLVPSSLIKRRLAAEVEGQVVVVGAHTLILPQGTAGPVEVEFYTKLLEAVAGLPGGIVGRVEVELLSEPELPAAGVLEVTVRWGSTGTPLGGLAQVVYGVGAEGGTDSGRGVGARIRQYLSVAVAARDLPAGTVLRWKDLALEERDIAGITGGFLSLEDHPEAFRTAAPLARGERIDPARLERHYLVRAGDLVTVTFLRPGLRVSLPGRAYSSGAAGDQVEVRPRDAARRFTGRVSPGGEVIVEEL